MNNSCLLADINRWVGVAIALVGSIVAAPGGTGLLLKFGSERLSRAGRAVRAGLARVLPFLRHKPRVLSGGAVGASMSTGRAVGTVSGSPWNPSASVDEQIERLRQKLDQLERGLNDASEKLSLEVNNREQALAALERKLLRDVSGLAEQVQKQEQQAALIDARGLPVIGFGIVLSGIPDELASLPLGMGWLFPIAGVVAAVGTLVHAIRKRHSTRTA